MIPTLLMVATFAGGYDPVPLPELVKIPGPYLKIPCKVAQPKEVACVQLYVSADRGKKWAMDAEIAPDQDAFTLCAKRPGEYWFAPRVKMKDGTFDPQFIADFVPMQRVLVETGTEMPAISAPKAKPSAEDELREVEDELNRVEFDLIRKEIKRLSEAKELDSATEKKLDRLRIRLRDSRERLYRDRNSAPSTLRASPDPLILPPPPVSDTLLPPTTLPTDPVIIPRAQVRPVAPMPRARE